MTTISTSNVAMKAAAKQMKLELRTNLLSGTALTYLITPVTVIVVMVLGKNNPLLDSTISVAQNFLPAMLAFGLVMGGMVGVAGELVTEREDGTMVRMKAIPQGLQGYLLGKTFTQLLLNFFTTVLAFIPAIIIFPAVTPATAANWLLLAAIFVLGIASMIPLGALTGALFRNATQLGIAVLMCLALAGVSGLFYPLAASPMWMQIAGQIFPLYWLGLGFRHAILPPEAAMLEIGGTWRTVHMFVVLGVWTLIGLLGAPRALRKMIRGVSGSKIVEARERMLSRGY